MKSKTTFSLNISSKIHLIHRFAMGYSFIPQNQTNNLHPWLFNDTFT